MKLERFTKEQWLEVSEYDLHPGELCKLNFQLYQDRKDDDRMELLKQLYKDRCPRDKHGYSCKKVGVARLAKILSGSEYNTHIVHTIMGYLEKEDK